MSIIEKLTGRGKSLYLAVSRNSLSNKAIAKKAGYKYNTFYSHIKKADLDFGILFRYGKALKYDFSVEYPEMSQNYAFEENMNMSYDVSFEKLERKYTQLLESHNELLIKYNDLQIELYLLKKA